MESQSEDEVNRLLTEWRRHMAVRGISDESTLDELESHLLEQMDHLLESGLAKREAFLEAAARLGHEDLLATEYRKVKDLPHSRREPAKALAWSGALAWSYLLVSLRQLRRNKGYALLNILGLTVALTAFLLIFLYVADELSYDRSHEHADRIYAVVLKEPESERFGARGPGLIAEVIASQVPEVEAATRLARAGTGVIARRDERVFIEPRLAFADSNFFEVLSYQFIRGEPQSALKDPNTVVLTREAAERYFGDEEPMGRELVLSSGWVGGTAGFRVTGVIERPANTSFPFDGLLSYSSWTMSETAWAHVFVRLKEGASLHEVTAKLPAVTGKTAEMSSWEAAGTEISLRPFSSLHLGIQGAHEFAQGAGGSGTDVLILALIGLFVLLLACVNYINLSTARSITRAREVGIRKVVGSSKGQLIRQHLFESLLLVAVSFGLALVVAQLLLPSFGAFADKEFAFRFFERAYTVPILIALAVAVGILAGAYPAFHLTRYDPVHVLKGTPIAGKKRFNLRRSLLVFQFAVSVGLIASTLVVYQQLEYVQEKELGFNKEHLLVVKNVWRLDEREHVFREAVAQMPHVLNVGRIDNLPGEEETGYIRLYRSADDLLSQASGSADVAIPMRHFTIDHGAIPTLKVRLVAGRNFRPASIADTSAVILNEMAARVLGLADPVGSTVYIRGWRDGTDSEGKRVEQIYARPHEVVGLVENFHYFSLHEEIIPMPFFPAYESSSYLALRLASGDTADQLRGIESIWTQIAPNVPFEFTWLDQEYDAAYRSDERLAALVAIFSGLAIIIACLGVTGLSAYMAYSRRKELGIRKVLGATALSITHRLSREFLLLVFGAFIVAVPLAYFGMSRWLDNFAYHIPVGPGPFLLAGTAVLGLALVAVSFHALRAAFMNPADALHYE